MDGVAWAKDDERGFNITDECCIYALVYIIIKLIAVKLETPPKDHQQLK